MINGISYEEAQKNRSLGDFVDVAETKAEKDSDGNAEH